MKKEESKINKKDRIENVEKQKRKKNETSKMKK